MRRGNSGYLVLLFLAFVATLTIAAKAFSYPAEVEDISGEKYFPRVKQTLSQAKESIFMAMFKVGLRPYDKSSEVYQLVEELIKAHKRGVEVKVILDQNVGFLGMRDEGEGKDEGKSVWCFKLLKDEGVDVAYDDPQKYTHAKAIIIDGETVILGSTNWTESALKKNIEASVLIRSKEYASELLNYLKKIEIAEPLRPWIDYTESPVPLSWKFLETPGLAGKMANQQDERSFDGYLLLLRKFDGNLEAKIVLDYDKMARDLRIYEKMDRTAYRRQIIKTMRKLEKRYHLIKFEPKFAKEGTITLLNYDDPTKSYAYPKEWYFHIPDTFWEYGWAQTLSFRAKICYLINLASVSISDTRPWWYATLERMSKRFHVSEYLISGGMQDLQRLNLIDVRYDELKPPYKERLAKSYKLLDLYEPDELEKAWDKLELEYGTRRVNQARDLARIVLEENDAAIVEDIIQTIEQYGQKNVIEAFAIIAKRRPDNPKRCYSYVKGIIKKLAEER